jgi:hypothetical protein
MFGTLSDFLLTFHSTQLTVSLHQDRERAVALSHVLAHDEIQKNRLKLAKYQNQLKSEILLGKLEISEVRRQHSDGHVESPNATDDCQCNERNEEQDYVVERLNVLDVNQIQCEEDCNVSDWHLKDQEAEEVELVPGTRKAFDADTSEWKFLLYFVIWDLPKGQQQQSGGVLKVKAFLCDIEMKLLSPWT